MKKGLKNLLNCLSSQIKVMSLIKDFESLRNLICIFCNFYPISECFYQSVAFRAASGKDFQAIYVLFESLALFMHK